MKYIQSALLLLFFSSCSDSFVNHEMKAVKIGACSTEITPVIMNSNINGERYEFNYCLDENFDSKNYTIERNGDSLLLKFPAATKKTTLYKLTLDIDAKPAYHYIKLGEQIITVVPAERL